MENDSAKASWLSLKLADQTLPERWGHSGVYHDSKLYIYGGCCGGVQFSDLLMLDLEAMSWKILVTSGQEPGPRDSHTAVLHDRKMIVFGGTSGSRKTNELHVLDLESLVWTRPTIQGSAPAPRESHTMTMVNANQALVFGGSGDGGKYLDDVHLLDCESMEWSAPMMKEDSPVRRDSHTSVVIEKKLFLYGGDCGDRYLGDVDVLDLESFTWSKLENASQPGVRAGHTAVAVGTKMYTFGGVGDRTYYNDAWIMDVETRIWSRLEVAGVHPQGRFSHVAALVDGGMVVYGGCGEDEKPLEELLVLNLRGKKMPESGIWSKIGTDYRIDIVQRKTSSQVSSRADNLKTSRFLRKLDRHCASKPAQKKRKSPNSSAVRESDALSLAESKISPRRPVPRYPTLRCSRNSDRSLTFQTEANGIQIGCEVYGVVDGVLDSGYLMTAHLNGQVLRGFLFNPDHESRETVATRPENSSSAVPFFPVFPANAAASIAVEEESTASKDTDNDNIDRIIKPLDLKQMPSPTRDEEQVTLSLFSN